MRLPTEFLTLADSVAYATHKRTLFALSFTKESGTNNQNKNTAHNPAQLSDYIAKARKDKPSSSYQTCQNKTAFHNLAPEFFMALFIFILFVISI